MLFKKFSTKNYNEVIDYCRKNLKFVGSGSFCSVYDIGENKVLRINKELYSLKYYEYCHLNPHIHLPKIHQITKLQGFYFCISEKYSHIPTEYEHDLSELVQEYFYYNKTFSNAEENLPIKLVLQVQCIERKLIELNKLFVYPDSGLSLDIDTTNMMWDGENLIINDPYYSGNEWESYY